MNIIISIEASSHENNRTIDEDTFTHIIPTGNDGELFSTNYLTSVREEPPSSDEHEEDEDE